MRRARAANNLTKPNNMKPKDIIRQTNALGYERFWEITAIMYGGVDQESNVELKSIGEHPNSDQHPTRCPVCILEDAIKSGSTRHYSC